VDEPGLLKPASDVHSQVIVLGEPWRDADARTYQQLKPELLGVVLDSLATLGASYDVVICEGPGRPTEINLRAGDILGEDDLCAGLRDAGDLVQTGQCRGDGAPGPVPAPGAGGPVGVDAAGGGHRADQLPGPAR
jgi:hypothetical protein